MRHLETFDHQSIDATNAQSVKNGHGAIPTLLSSDQHFTACNTFRIRERLLNDEQSSQGNGKHGAKQSSEGGNDQGLQPLNLRPNTHDKKCRDGENYTSSQRFTRRCHGLYCVVFEDGYITEEGSQDDHGHHCGRNARRNGHSCIQSEVCIRCCHQHPQDDPNHHHSEGQFLRRFIRGNVRLAFHIPPKWSK